MLIALIHKRELARYSQFTLMTSFFKRYQPMRSWLTLLLYIVGLV